MSAIPEPIRLGDDVTLYCADCLDVLPALAADDSIAVITDPPYGIGWSGHRLSTCRWDKMIGDDGMDLRPILNLPTLVVAFGANNYPEQLPHPGRWICWDKRTIDGAADAMLGSPFELAWCNKREGLGRIYRVLHGGAIVDGAPGHRHHPTQKPIHLMSSIIADYAPPAATIVDPFMGSGTTGVAAVQMGRRFIGIERDPKYFDTAKRRIEEAQNHLFREVSA